MDKFLCMGDEEKKEGKPPKLQDVDALKLDFKSVRKRPVVVAAALYRGDDIWIETLNGAVLVSDGEYIVRGVEGEFYPISASLLAQTYTDV